MVQLLAKPVISLLSAYRKDVVDMYYSNTVVVPLHRRLSSAGCTL